MNRKLFLVWALAAGVIAGSAGLAATAAEAPPAGPADAAPGAALVQRACVGCHALDTVTGQGRSAQEWSDTVDRMQDHGVDATDAELAQIKAYLAKTYPAVGG